jgi:hypothetical protein
MDPTQIFGIFCHLFVLSHKDERPENYGGDQPGDSEGTARYEGR